MPRPVDLFAKLSGMPPDELADLCRKLQSEKPETAAIIARVLGGIMAPVAAPAPVEAPANAPRFKPPVAQAAPSYLKSVSRADAEAAASGNPPPGYELPPEFLSDGEP